MLTGMEACVIYKRRPKWVPEKEWAWEMLHALIQRGWSLSQIAEGAGLDRGNLTAFYGGGGRLGPRKVERLRRWCVRLLP
jgi:hypothetical protein